MEIWHVPNKDLLSREEKNGRSSLVSLEMWHITNKDLLARGEKWEKWVSKLEYVAHYK